MHRCLQISEVVQAICDQTSRRNLVSLARTCQALRDTALDAIWHTQKSLLPLVKCLPPHIWEEVLEKKGRTLRLLEPITPDDWTRVQMYDHRVKKLAIESAELDANFFRALELSAPEPFLLPNLRVLSWTIEDDGYFPFCRLFLPPTLVTVVLVLQDCTPDLSLFSTLRLSHPHLTDIHVDVPPSPASVRVISSAVSAWKFIKKLTVVSLDEGALTHIANLPQLQDLQMQSYVPPTVCYKSLAMITPSKHFPALQHIDISSDTVQSAFSLIAGVSSEELRQLHINAEGCSVSEAWEVSLAALERLPSRPHLTSLSLSQRTNNLPSLPVSLLNRYILGPRTLASLLTFSSLVKVLLHPCFGFDLDDATIHQMATSWPCLEILELGGERDTPRRPRTTLRSIVYLAEHCPQLHSLQLAVDATDPVPRFSRQRKTRPQHMLSYFHTGPSPISSPPLVAAFLSNVFAAIAFGHRPDTDANRPWTEVARLFQVFRSVRAAESRCWTMDASSDEEGWSDGGDSSEDDETSDYDSDV
ncbi:hypothetical protein C8R43DRAFT_1139272 [Mycena crocata]|nr:hypothetical protein C8R43DRAFT_1139272 [Mycena crocata]